MKVVSFYIILMLVGTTSCAVNRSVEADVYMFEGDKMLYIFEHNKFYYARLGPYYNPDYISYGTYIVNEQQEIFLNPKYDKNVETISLELIPSNDTTKMEIIIKDERGYSMLTNCGTLVVNDSIRIVHASDSISFIDEDIIDFRYESPNANFVSDKVMIPDRFTGTVILKLDFNRDYLGCDRYDEFIWEDTESANFMGSDFRNFQTIELDTSYSVSVSRKKFSLLHYHVDDYVLEYLLKRK